MQQKDNLARIITEQLQKTVLLRAKHCYTRQLVSPAKRKRCDFCRKTMFLMTLRCKDCRVRCHRHCAQQAADLCELAASHPLATGNKHKGTYTLPECRTRLGSLSNNRTKTPEQSSTPSSRKSSTNSETDSFREYLPHRASFNGKRFATRNRLSTTFPASSTSETTTAPANSLNSTPSRTNGHVVPQPPSSRTSRSTLSSLSSNRSSVSGYYSQDSDNSLVSDCDSVTPTADVSSVFDSFAGPGPAGEVALALGSFSNFLFQSHGGDGVVVIEPSLPERDDEDAAGTETITLTSSHTLSLISTWPMNRKDKLCRHLSDNTAYCEEAEGLDGAESYEVAPFFDSSHPEDRDERLGEWAIPHEDLKYGRCIGKGATGNTFRGHWHGEVLIQTRDATSTDIDDFLDEVSMLSMIRHENIALFMGACIEPGQLAVVNSINKGPSLYQYLHVQQKKLAVSSRAIVARQIAQAMGYLHAKGIVVGHLSSRCIFLEAKVKLSVTRVDTDDVTCQRPGYASLARGELSYLAPELLATCHVTPPELHLGAAQTQQTDVFAFGTTLFEILAGHWPLQHACAESIIYQTCKGKRDRFNNVSCARNHKDLVYDCWAHEPHNRPSFPDIVKSLKKNVAIGSMKHSLSEPDNLNRVGTSFPW